MHIVTGANGFIGSVLVRELNSMGVKDIICVDSVDLNERPEPLNNAEYEKFMVISSFLDWLSVDAPSKNIEAVFHMGAISTTTETDWNKLKKNNIELSQTLFRFCTEKKIPFIYASSAAVYGDGQLGFDDSSDATSFTPLNLYGKSKQEFDVWALKQKETPPRWYGLRFFNVYGPNEYHKNEMASVIYKAFLQISKTGSLKLFRSHHPDYKDGEQLRDFVYVKDICRWMWEFFTHTKLPSGIYNQGSGTARSWLDLAKQVFKSLGKNQKISWIDIPESIRNQYQYFTEANMQKSFKSGLSKPQFNLESGVDDYLKNHLLNDDPFA